VKRCVRDETIWVVMYISMETTQGISLYSYLHLKLGNTLCFSFYLICFFFNKIGEQESGIDSAQRQGGGGGKWPK
jgi:hypothetical protein